MENFFTNFSYYGGTILIAIGVIFLGLVTIQMIQGKREKNFSKNKIVNYLGGILSLIPVSLGIWVLPIAMGNKAFLPLDSPEYYTYNGAAVFLIAATVIFYGLTQLSSFFPHKNKYYNLIPSLLVLTTIPGLANSSLIMIINQFVQGTTDVVYLVFMFAVSAYVLVLTSRISGRKVAILGNMLAHDYNMKIFQNIFKFSYRDYEKTASGKLYTVLNDDIGTLFQFSQHLPNLYSSLVTIIVVNIYLWTISFWGSMSLLVATVALMFLQSFITGSISKSWNKARSARENYTDLVTGLVNGFKELIVHGVKRGEYMKDLKSGSNTYYKSHREAMYVDIDKTIFANFAFTFAIGFSCLVFPIMFNYEKELITTFTLTMLFLWGPTGAIITSLPMIMRVQVSRKRISEFISNMTSSYSTRAIESGYAYTETVQTIEAENVYFNYESEDDEFSMIGPVNIKASQGEVTFIIGGNGSGKTTLLKLLTGLYRPTKGQILINGTAVDSANLGEYFSIIYSDFYIYKKIYGIKPERLGQVNEWLKMLRIDNKVNIENGEFSTIDLSKGQRKRLALLRSYLEDRPINIYDECAADLDPEFKEFFYNVLLPKMKREQKVIIIISHDDSYFSIADKIYKMNIGKSSLIQSAEMYNYESNGVAVEV